MATNGERPGFDPRPRESYLRPIPEIIADLIPLHARRAAIRNAATSLTYGELGDYAARIAHAMLEAGIRPQDRALLLFDHRPQALAAMLGVLQSGAIAVPLTASTPLARRDLIMRDAEPACVVTDLANEHEARALAPQRLPVITVERLPPAPPRLWPALQASDPSVIIYTSGSTGHPKGVVQSHRSIMHKVWATAQKFETTPDDRITMFSTYAVGQGLTATMSALVCGATVCQFDVRRMGFERLATWLADERISIYISSATLFRALTRAAAAELRCPDLRLIRLGSERVTVEDVSAARKLFAPARLLIAYSSTETANVAMHFIGDDETFPGGIVPAGLPNDSVSVAIVDDAGQPLARGQEGEIVVRSPYLPSGYWRDPERTARTYLPVAGAPADRECRTGDVGRIRPDGCLEILGRKDRRVKVRGFRIELDEIEALLSTHPSVARAAVVARPDHRGDPMLVAYLEMSALETPIEEVRRFALARMPDHMVPTTFVMVETMPVGDLGKVDRSRLPDPPPERPSMSAEYVPPRTPLERTIGAIWQEVLGHSAIGVHDPFLMVGGDSLRAAQIASRLSSALDLEVPLWELLEASTIANLAEIIAGKQTVLPASVPPPGPS